MKGYNVENGTIIINRDLTELDFFVKNFLDILEKHSSFLIVSGFVSISTGRTRGTEDIDVLVPLLEFEEFRMFFDEIDKHGFWCYQGNDAKEVYSYLKEMMSVRFARKGEVFPNMEVIPVTPERKTKWFELNHPQDIKIKDFVFKIPPLEFEILYKEMILGGEKDLADARHLREFFKDILRNEKFKEFETLIKLEI
ncbi:MAG: hypothetical protein Q8Q01_04220 [archaeon]|nr:hypothetical protein [archaeon]